MIQASRYHRSSRPKGAPVAYLVLTSETIRLHDEIFQVATENGATSDDQSQVWAILPGETEAKWVSRQTLKRLSGPQSTKPPKTVASMASV